MLAASCWLHGAALHQLCIGGAVCEAGLVDVCGAVDLIRPHGLAAPQLARDEGTTTQQKRPFSVD
jgi:hypothetical protein